MCIFDKTKHIDKKNYTLFPSIWYIIIVLLSLLITIKDLTETSEKGRTIILRSANLFNLQSDLTTFY